MSRRSEGERLFWLAMGSSKTRRTPEKAPISLENPNKKAPISREKRESD
jgi:hypothetical protein